MNLQHRSTKVGDFPEHDIVQVFPDGMGESVAWFWKLRTAAAFINLVNLSEDLVKNKGNISINDLKQLEKALKAIKKQTGKL